MNKHDGIGEALAFLQKSFPAPPDLAIVLGSGLGSFADALQDPIAIPSSEIPNYPRSTVQGHKGELVFGTLGEQRILAVRGRVHLYETGLRDTVLFPIRVVAGLGARKLVITNAAGGVNRRFVPGDLMVISDQLNLTGRSPLHGAQFVNMVDAYSPALRTLARDVDPSLREGVYAGLPGPQYETPAEITMLKTIGADLVGMSTVHETIAARAAGLDVLGVSLVTNLAAGITGEPLAHSEVLEVGRASATRMGTLLAEVVTALDRR